ncbi:hypothetical protein C8J55DRAFT_496986 [Lentinula edodes]|uniref:Uncharacterized protein n=1 Tax=Lentinula lateritia TaxID=40482 RepID=A0A9W9E0A9_9AGAR|nr:hypothetical protein C8J55DRAFT_496986 [Lentinula edodes]
MNVIAFFRRKNGHEHAQAIVSQFSTPAHTTVSDDDDSRAPEALANASTDEDNLSTHIDKNTSQFGKRSPATKQSHKSLGIGRGSSPKSMKNVLKNVLGLRRGFMRMPLRH